jgi:hypothetical protein
MAKAGQQPIQMAIAFSTMVQRASHVGLGAVLFSDLMPIWTTRKVAKAMHTMPDANNAITATFCTRAI